MRRKTFNSAFFSLSVLLILALGLAVPRVLLAQSALPSLGDRISGTVSLDQEYSMGQGFLKQIRRSAPLIPDALLNDYLENVTFKLAARSQLQDHRLSFVIIDSEEINAFAAPGGVIGVNSGLFLNAQTEGEFASVLAHEIAHVSQRHFARGIDEAQSGRIPQMAALLASVLIMATSDAGHGQAALAAAQGRAMDNQLRFSRNNEAEADRIGQDTMYQAGFDPNKMTAMFERMVANNRFGRRPPEFLLTHPITERRVSDARGRASRYPERPYTENLEYQIMRSRVLAHYAKDKEATVSQFQQLLADSSSEFTRDANRYGLAVAYWENNQFKEAADTLNVLLEKEPNRISYVVTQAEILIANNEPFQAAEYLERHLDINPDNHPLAMVYFDAKVEARAYEQAASFLEQHAVTRSDDHNIWFQIAEVQGQAGNISEVHQARAEYYKLIGDYSNARLQYQYALRIERDNGALPAEQSRLRQRMMQVEAMERELQR